MYHDRTAWRCAFFVGKKYGSKGYPQGNAAQLGFVTYLLNRPRTYMIISRAIILRMRKASEKKF
jgi:hypothetical protein